MTVPCSSTSAHTAFSEITGSVINAMAGPAHSSCTLSSMCAGYRATALHLECNVLSLTIAVKPQYQPLALPGLLQKVSLDRLLILEMDTSTIRRLS